MEFPEQLFYIKRLALAGFQFPRADLDGGTEPLQCINPIQDFQCQLLLRGLGERRSFGDREFERLDHAAFIADVSLGAALGT
jgi:hypothetical protein